MRPRLQNMGATGKLSAAVSHRKDAYLVSLGIRTPAIDLGGIISEKTLVAHEQLVAYGALHQPLVGDVSGPRLAGDRALR